MQATDSHVTAGATTQDRVDRIVEQTGSKALASVARGVDPGSGEPIASERDREDWLSTCLMDVYRCTGNRDALAMLFELHRTSFLRAITGLLPSGMRSLDPEDVLQDAFAAICRYPHQFHADRAAAFRNWGHRIVRNTLFRCVRGRRRLGVQQVSEDEWELEDHRDGTPDQVVMDREEAPAVDHAFVLLLGVYMACFESLAERDRRLLCQVELEGCPYSKLAAELGVPVGTVKVRVFRGRQRVARRIEQALKTMAGSASA